MAKIFITGVSGTGKTTLAQELAARGVFSIDIDKPEYNLCFWVNEKTSKKAEYKHGVSKEWLQQHAYVCNIVKLKKLISTKENAAIAGIVSNQKDFFHLFDKVVLLQCSEEVLVNRLNHRTSHDFGKTKSEQDFILNFYKDFENEMLELGAIPINADGSAQKVADQVLPIVHSA